MGNMTEDFNSIWVQIEPIIINKVKQTFPDEKELVDNLAGILKLAKTVQLTGDRAARRLSLDFLYEAERDIQSCKVLYSKKLYPHAAYHFQQAVEKATKGYVLGFGFLSIYELRTHNTPELFLMAALEKTGIEPWANRVCDEGLKTLISKPRQIIRDREQRLQVARTSYDNIKADLSELAAYRNISKQMCQSLIEEISPIIGAEVPPPPLYQAMSAMATLFILAAISFPHEEYTRYPDQEIVPSDYVAGLGVVRAIPRMIKCLTPEIQELETIIQQV